MEESILNKNDRSKSILPDGLLNDGEKVILSLKPSGWLIYFLTWRWFFWVGIASLILAVWGPNLKIRSEIFIIGIWLLAGFRFGLAVLQWTGLSYVLTERRIIRTRGVFNIDILQCDLNRIQHTQLYFPLAERILGLGSIGIATAGTGNIELYWITIQQPLEINQIINNTIDQTAKTTSQSDISSGL